MEFLTTTYKDDPQRVNEYLGLVRKVYNDDPEGRNFSIPEIPTTNHYVLAIDDQNKVVGGLTLEIFDRSLKHTPHFLRRSVFNTLKRKLPHMDEENTQLAEINHIVVDPSHRNNGIGTKVLAETFTQASKQGVELSLVMVNNDALIHMIENAAARSHFSSGIVGRTDFITHNWDRLRNTKSIVAIAHTPEMTRRLSEHKRGNVLWRPKSPKTVFASPYADGGGINGVLFDWDGTLVDEVPLWASAIGHTLRDLKRDGSNIPENIWLSNSQHPKEYLKSVLGEALAEKAYPLLMKHYDELMPQILKLQPEALETLRMLKKNKIPFAIVSNAQDPALSKQVKRLLGEEFSNVPIFADAQKPTSTSLLKAVEALGLKNTENVYYVGDSGSSDIMGALNANLRPVLFSYGDMDIATTLSNQERSERISLVKDHEELQKFIAAQLVYQGAQMAGSARKR